MTFPPEDVTSCQSHSEGASDWHSFAKQLKLQAGKLGFCEPRIAPAVEPGRFPQFLQWLENGYAGEMHYLETRREAYRHPDSILDGVSTLLIMAVPYSTAKRGDLTPGTGRIARYASGKIDYHDWIHERLKILGNWLQLHAPSASNHQQPHRWRGVVDTAPLLEREFAQIAGLGWIGKNTLLLNRTLGSYFFLATLLTNLPLPCDESFWEDHCGSCTACLDACPTDAFVSPRVLDATRCISYLTIEARGLPSLELRPGISDWLYGSDVCQEVCPWNRKAPSIVEPNFLPQDKLTQLPLASLLEMSEAEFRDFFRHTPFWRAKRRGLLRNAAIVAANTKNAQCIPSLLRLLTDQEELIRAASVWALSQMANAEIYEQLQRLKEVEASLIVLEELGRIPNLQ